MARRTKGSLVFLRKRPFDRARLIELLPMLALAAAVSTAIGECDLRDPDPEVPRHVSSEHDQGSPGCAPLC
jgi:hypothetical protein